MSLLRIDQPRRGKYLPEQALQEINGSVFHGERAVQVSHLTDPAPLKVTVSQDKN